MITSTLLTRIGISLDAAGKGISEKHLIVFEKKSLILISVLLVLFVTLVSFKIHYSSVAIWDAFFPSYGGAQTASKVLFGSPKFIRVDEWLTATPFFLSQAANNFPVENYSFGPKKVSLLIGLPTSHFSIFFQPQYWGFFVLQIEKGFSYIWNYGAFSLMISSFLLFMLLTKNNLLLSVFGCLFLFFSSFVQWWNLSTPSVVLSAFNCILISSIYVVSSTKRLTMIISAAALFLFILNFSLAIYPPFQVPLGLLMIAVLTGYFVKNLKRDVVMKHVALRLCLLGACFVAVIIVACFFYTDLKETIALTMNTAYPGKRISSGGGFGIDRLFSGFYGIFFNEQKFLWLNVCETSSFLFFFPVIVTAVLVDAIKGKYDPLQLALSGYLLFLTFFVVVGFPPILSKVTLLTFVPSYRAVIGIGVGSIILTVVYLHSKNSAIRFSPSKNMILFVILLTCFAVYGLYLNSRTNNFFQVWQLGLISVFFSLAVCLLLNHKTLLFCLAILVYVVLSTYSVYPISRGLGFIIDKKLYHAVKNIVVTDPQANWIVYGDEIQSGFVVATGARVFNGTKYVPDMSAMKILDPSGKNEAIYNRFAHVMVLNRPEVDKVNFKRFYEDSYGIGISPFSQKLRDLKIKYLLMPDYPGYYDVEEGKNKGVVPVLNMPIDHYWVLEIKGD
jgi:hypothetical protein